MPDPKVENSLVVANLMSERLALKNRLAQINNDLEQARNRVVELKQSYETVSGAIAEITELLGDERNAKPTD